MQIQLRHKAAVSGPVSSLSTVSLLHNLCVKKVGMWLVRNFRSPSAVTNQNVYCDHLHFEKERGRTGLKIHVRITSSFDAFRVYQQGHKRKKEGFNFLTNILM